MSRRPRGVNRQSQITKGSPPAKGLSNPVESFDRFESECETDSEPESFEGYSFSDARPEDAEDGTNLDSVRVSQWIDEDELEDGPLEDSQKDERRTEEADLNSIKDNLDSLPLGTLRRAQRALAQTTAESDSEDSSASENDVQTEAPPRKKERNLEWTSKPNVKLSKRSSKHAPMEVSSKKPVTRNRSVVEVQSIQPRDPRFLPLAGNFSETKFHKEYAFLAETRVTELHTLRETLRRARKLLTSTPRDQRPEQELEISRLELAVKRAESAVNRDKREKVDRAALERVAQEEKEKQKHGKRGFWLKNAEKKELLVRARYEALAAEGGRHAVKKAIEKKQKKIGQKEKKSRPFREDRGGPAQKRSGSPTGISRKRQRVS